MYRNRTFFVYRYISYRTTGSSRLSSDIRYPTLFDEINAFGPFLLLLFGPIFGGTFRAVYLLLFGLFICCFFVRAVSMFVFHAPFICLFLSGPSFCGPIRGSAALFFFFLFSMFSGSFVGLVSGRLAISLRLQLIYVFVYIYLHTTCSRSGPCSVARGMMEEMQ